MVNFPQGDYLGSSTKIDQIDARIIKILLAESRTSFTDIAKECEISVSAVRMRYKHLWKEGIITGEITLVNPHCLGYRHIVDLGITTEVEDEAEIASYLESRHNISQIVRQLGKYNFYAKAALRDLNKLSEVLEDIEANPKIKKVDALIWAEAVNLEFPSNLTIDPLPREDANSIKRPILTDIDQALVKIDETDRKIAAIVANKARTPFRQIADELDISTKTVIQRYKRLRENLLPRSTITLDLNKLGFEAFAHLYMRISNRSKMSEIYSQLLNIPNVIVIIRLFGTYDLYVAVALENFNKMFEVFEKISRISGLEKPEVTLTPIFAAWPLNLFPELLEKTEMSKYYSNTSLKKQNHKPLTH